MFKFSFVLGPSGMKPGTKGLKKKVPKANFINKLELSRAMLIQLKLAVEFKSN